MSMKNEGTLQNLSDFENKSLLMLMMTIHLRSWWAMEKRVWGNSSWRCKRYWISQIKKTWFCCCWSKARWWKWFGSCKRNSVIKFFKQNYNAYWLWKYSQAVAAIKRSNRLSCKTCGCWRCWKSSSSRSIKKSSSTRKSYVCRQS